MLGRAQLERAIVVTALATLASRCALGASTPDSWAGTAGDFSWDDGANWSTAAYPSATNSADFLIGGITANEAITVTNAYTLAGIAIGDGTNAVPNFTLSGAALTFTGNVVGIGPTGATTNPSNQTRVVLQVKSGSLGTYTINNNLTLTNSANFTASNPAIFLVDGTSSKVILNGALTVDSGESFAKFGSGTLELTNPNSTNTGTINIAVGSLVAGGNDPAANGTPGVFGEGSYSIRVGSGSSASTTAVGLDIAGSYTVARNISVGPVSLSSTIGGSQAGATGIYSGSISLTKSILVQAVSATGTVDFNGAISDGSGSNSITNNGAGTVVFNSANTYGGYYEALSGVTVVGNSAALGSSSADVIVSGSASTAATSLLTANGITFARNVTVAAGTAGAAGATLGGTGGQASSSWSGNLTLYQNTALTGGSAGTTYFSGNIVDGAATNVDPTTGVTYSFVGSSISKIGAGTVVLSGTDSYTGTTSINAGTLLLASTGQLTGGGTVTVNTGGYFGGSGTVAAPIVMASGGTLFAGNGGTGSLNAASNVNNVAGSTLQIKVQYPVGTTPVEGSDNDVIKLTGAGAVFTPGGATLQLLPAINTFPSSFAPITYVIVDGGSSSTIDPNTTFANLANGVVYFDGTSTYSVNYGTNDITLTLDSVSSPTPEPANIGLLSLGGCALLRRRRRALTESPTRKMRAHRRDTENAEKNG